MTVMSEHHRTNGAARPTKPGAYMGLHALPIPAAAPVTNATRPLRENNSDIEAPYQKGGSFLPPLSAFMKNYLAMQVSAVSGVQTSRPV